jgi:hypothetical protein
MTERLRLDIDPPSHGWATVRLTAPGVAVEFVASYTPRDSVGDLARAAAGLAAGVPEQVVVCNTEPAEYELQFATASGWTRLQIRQYPDATRQRGRVVTPVGVIEGDAVAIARALWRGLRRLQGAMTAEEFSAAWGYPFPVMTVERLGEHLRGQAARPLSPYLLPPAAAPET